MVSVPSWTWLVFAGTVAALLVIDLLAHRGRADSRRSAIAWSAAWVGVGLAFAGFVWAVLGGEAAVEYLAAYLLEKSLSLDNLFVFLIIFHSLNIPAEQHRRVLSWGIFGALAFRAIFIFVGVAAIERYQWVVYVFGGLLFWAAIRTFREHPMEAKESRLVHWLSNHIPVTHEVKGHRFVVDQGGRLVATPLLLAVCAVELTDIIFAIDSVPAALAVTRNRFIVYSSNAFAILGLRALYIVLEKTLAELQYLHYGLAAVLAFAAFKLVAPAWIHIPPLLSVAIIVVCIAVSAWASVRARRKEIRKETP